MIVVTNAHLAMGMLEFSSFSHLFIPKGLALKDLCSIGGCFGILCLRELACKIMNNAICSSKRKSKPICNVNHAKAYGSMIPCMFPMLRMNGFQNNSSKKWL